jgi:hypothetical protein
MRPPDKDLPIDTGGQRAGSGSLLWRLVSCKPALKLRSGYGDLYEPASAAAESGTVTVFRENGKTLASEGAFSMPHAHTVCVDPETHLVYFPLQNIDGHPALRIMAPSGTY